jgi:hypothetical protein
VPSLLKIGRVPQALFDQFQSVGKRDTGVTYNGKPAQLRNGYIVPP